MNRTFSSWPSRLSDFRPVGGERVRFTSAPQILLGRLTVRADIADDHPCDVVLVPARLSTATDTPGSSEYRQLSVFAAPCDVVLVPARLAAVPLPASAAFHNLGAHSSLRGRPVFPRKRVDHRVYLGVRQGEAVCESASHTIPVAFGRNEASFGAAAVGFMQRECRHIRTLKAVGPPPKQGHGGQAAGRHLLLPIRQRVRQPAPFRGCSGPFADGPKML